MTEERKAVYYGEVQLIPGVVCDGYVLDDGTAVMSERGTADLLGMDHKALQNVATTGAPKVLNSFIPKDFSMATTLIEVVAGNSPHKGRKIVVYSTETIETLISAYTLAAAYHTLQKNQRHIGERCAQLAISLIRTALGAAIREACGLPINIQRTVQNHFIDVVKLACDMGLMFLNLACNYRLSFDQDCPYFAAFSTA